jgi:3-hydroxybutyryl-CoA dehydratase
MNTATLNARLGPLTRTVTYKTIQQYEEILGIGNPLHFDEEYARGTPFGGIIAHGMMGLAYVSEMMSQAFGKGWHEGGELDATFVLPVRPGDTITTWGSVTGQRRSEGRVHVACDVSCKNQKGESVLVGTAEASVDEFISGVPEVPGCPGEGELATWSCENTGESFGADGG